MNDDNKKKKKKRIDVSKFIELNPKLDEQSVDEEPLDERAPLTVQQRRQRGRVLRRFKSKIAAAKKRARRRKASPEKLKARAQKKARNIIRQRFLQGKNYASLSPAEKVQVDKRLLRIPDAAIKRIAVRQLPQVRKAELERLSRMRGGAKNEELDIMFEMFLQENQDDDHPYHKGLAPSTADKRRAHFNKKAKKDPGDPSAYEPAPGDIRAKTKPSSYTKRYHSLFKKEGTVKHDMRFKFNRRKENPYFKEDIDLLIENKEAIKNKAKETGITYGILKKVFDRGVAAWRTGHRPGTNPTQWGLARINSFATGGKTRTTADADLWKQHSGNKKESFIDTAYELMENIENMFSENVTKSADDPCWDGYVQLGTKKKGGKDVPNCVKRESSNSADREEGTDSLVNIYKKATSGETKTESYYDNEILAGPFSEFERGSRIRFSAHSMDMFDDEEHEGTVVGSNVQHLRVRDDDGILYKVRQVDAELIESAFTFTIDEKFEMGILSENMIDKAVEAIRRHVTKGKSLEDVIWDFSSATGFKIPTKEIYKHYIELYGEPEKRGSKMSQIDRNKLVSKYS